MRTTLTIDDDVLAVARYRADRESRTIGEVISELARTGVRAELQAASVGLDDGFPTIRRAPGSRLVTLEDVNRLRDELP